jgi:GNAT superfamily N-acetyltransferase
MAADAAAAEGVLVVEADLRSPDHAAAVTRLVDTYAADPMGNGARLPAEVLAALIPGLRAHPTTIVFLAYRGETPVGVAVCFRGFSTFAARQLINVHDLAVLPEHRGHGVGRRLLEAVERKGRELDCCKLTLEVQEGNGRARALYKAMGFAQAVYQEAAGGSLFLTKPLEAARRGADGA